MSDKIHAYLQAGEALERQAHPGPWFREHTAVSAKRRDDVPRYICGGGSSVDDSAFIADARTRLPLYRKALEAVLNIKPDLLVCEKGMGEDLGEKFVRPESIVAAIESVFSEAEAKA